MARKFRVAAASVAVAALASSALAIGPANAETEPITYMESVAGAVAEVTQILSSGDSFDGYTWPGTPDGLGALKNADGTITVFVTHEFSASDAFVAAIERPYGGFGSDITAVRYNPATKSIVKVESAIKSAVWYDYQTGEYSTTPEAPEDAPNVDAYNTPNHTTAINRFCSASLAKAGDLIYKEAKRVKYFVKKNGKKVAKFKTVYTTFGTGAPVFLTNEEGSDESRVFALNTKTGQLAQLAALGLGGFENTNVAPAAATKKATVVMLGEDGDATDSQLYMYKGMKQKTGTWYQRAGLTNGIRYVSEVLNSGVSVANDVAARTALAKVNVASVKRGVTVAASTVAVVEGQVTVATASAHNLKVGDTVTLSGFTTGINGEVTVEAVGSATTFTFGADLDNQSATADAGTVALAADTVVVTTASAHGLLEGDTVNLAGVEGFSGKYVVTGAPSSTVFTVTAAGAAADLGAAGTANEVLAVNFRAVPTNLAGDAQNVLARLRGTEFARVEDGHFNPANPNEFYFVTTQSDSDGVGAPGVKEGNRDGGAIWKLTFQNVAKPALGATLELVLNGTEAPVNDASVKINKPDNMAFSADGKYLLIQEDPGNHDQLSRLLALRLSDSRLVAVARFKDEYFNPNSDGFITRDEESSGVIDVTSLLAASGDSASYFMFDTQIHPMTSAGGNSYGNDYQRARAVALMRPDLISQTSVSVSAITGEVAASGSRRVALTLTGVTANADNNGFVINGGGTIDVNDIITVRGVTTGINGTYVVTSIDVANNKVKVTTKDTNSAEGDITPIGTAHIVVTNSDADLALKSSIIEGGALYTLKITSWDDLFAPVG